MLRCTVSHQLARIAMQYVALESAAPAAPGRTTSGLDVPGGFAVAAANAGEGAPGDWRQPNVPVLKW